MKKSRIGYIGKTWIDSPFIYKDCKSGEYLESIAIFTYKGTKKQWSTEDYPPIKVKLTIETI